MTSLRIEGGRPLRGQVRVPGDKSISHRALILAALAEGISVVRGLSPGADVAGTAAAVQALGAVVDGHLVTGGRSRLHEPSGVLDVGNSGTTIRLLAGLCAGFDWVTVLSGDESIARRPMDRVAEPLRLMGATVEGSDGGRLPPITVRGGGLHGIDYQMPVASAQVKAAILLAALSAEGETVVRESTPTRAHSEEMLDAAGADIEVADGIVRLRPSALHPFELDVPGDPSQAAFWVVAACIVPGSELVIDDVYLGPARAGFLDVLVAMGADVERVGERSLRARYSPDLHGTDVEGHQIPGLIDEIPVLAVAAAVAEGTTTFRGAGELRVKESDRLATVTSELSALGGKVEPTDDGLTVTGTGTGGGGLHGGHVRSHGDHRVAMAMAVAAMAAAGDTVVDGWDAVATSYPGFEDDLRRCV